jgi:hypothetical protein
VAFRKEIPLDDRHNVTALAALLAARTAVAPTDILPVAYLHELDAYQDTAPYKHDRQVAVPTTDTATLLAAARHTSLSLADHALATLGKTPNQIGYLHPIGNDALGGFGTVALDHYARTPLGERERLHITNSERVNALHTFLGGGLADSQLARVESNWFAHNAPADALDRIVAVMLNPATWLDLLVKTSYRETDDRPPPKGW